MVYFGKISHRNLMMIVIKNEANVTNTRLCRRHPTYKCCQVVHIAAFDFDDILSIKTAPSISENRIFKSLFNIFDTHIRFVKFKIPLEFYLTVKNGLLHKVSYKRRKC